jgi:hypothetical protein
MPKKTGLATATKPPVDPEKWVQDTQPVYDSHSDDIARMTVELPGDMHREFKGKCGREGLKIKKVVTALVQEYLAGNIKITKADLH